MIFQELQTGDYFRIPGMSAELVYRKASDSQCSINALLQPNSTKISVLPLLQPIRSSTTVILLTPTEIANYFATKQEYLSSLWK
ncbi:MAG: hypothetical protein PUP92_14540 [Rhizonema sp. PD38]|nr:hypothetical protein [Rhizonema sp. PD38]